MSPTEWPVLRSCWRLGAAAPTAEIVREVQRDRAYSYRHVQDVLLRLEGKGYLSSEKLGPRRKVWTSTFDAKDILKQELRCFVDEVVGLEPENLQMLREVLDDVERHGPFVAFDADGLPRDLRVRLMTLLERFIKRKRDRWALAAALRVKPESLDEEPTLARTMTLLMAGGGDTISSALKLLGAVDQLLEDDEAEAAEEVSALQLQLEELSAS